MIFIQMMLSKDHVNLYFKGFNMPVSNNDKTTFSVITGSVFFSALKSDDNNRKAIGNKLKSIVNYSISV